MAEKKKTEIWPYSYEKLTADLLDWPTSLRNCIDSYYKGNNRKILGEAKDILESIEFSHVVFVGNTFNYFAGFVPRFYLISEYENKQFWADNFEITEFFDYKLPQYRDDDTLYIFSSKSGDSRLLRRCVEHLKMLQTDSKKIWLITNNIETEIAQQCGLVFPILVESEQILGTKSFQNTILVQFLISRLLIGLNFNSDNLYDEILNLISEMELLGEQRDFIGNQIIDFLGLDFQFLYFLSRGASLSAAYQIALAAKTYARFYAEGLSFGLFFHGPFQIADENFRCVFLIGDEYIGGTDDILPRLIDITTKKIGKGKTIIISNNKSIAEEVADSKNVLYLEYQCKINSLSPIIQMYITMMAFLEIAQKKGLILFM